LERKKGISFEKLMLSVSLCAKDEDTLTSLASRLARMNREINDSDRREIEDAGGGKPFRELIARLFDAFDPDKKAEKTKETFKIDKPTLEQKRSWQKLYVNYCLIPN
jgi:type I restriction enzyme, R subunit